MEVNPLSIILVKSDSKGDRLLFRYPFHIQENNEPHNTQLRNPYTLLIVEDLLESTPHPTCKLSKDHLTGFSDEVLSSLFAVKLELCNRKFELKVNDVRFVSHPTLLQRHNKQHDESGPHGLLINLVFALHAVASHSVVKCYHDLSKRLGIALKHDENRCGYVSEQTQVMMAAHDDGYSSNPKATFQSILEKCSLASNMKKIYDDLCGGGLVHTRINEWILLSFCLPQKAHQWHLRGKAVQPGDIDLCLRALMPYHSLLLLYPVQQMNDFISLDGSPSLTRMLSQYSPLKNLQTLAADADLTLSHVFELTAHLVYWAKAIIIFPICTANKYVISSEAPIYLNSSLVDKFNEVFPGMNLIRVISEFSLPTSLGQKYDPFCPPSQHSQFLQMIIWMLQHHLLLQLHTYIQYLPSSEEQIISEDHYVSDKEEVLEEFPSDEEKSLIVTNSQQDLNLFNKLHKRGYFQGNHHIEEIMYLENLKRSQILQLLDKFRDVLVTYETNDPAITMFACSV